MRADFPALHLLFVGPLEPQDPIPQDVEASLRKDPRVHLIGEEWDTPALYATMDVLVLPTYGEGLPGVLLEAAAMQVPVVATCVMGIPIEPISNRFPNSRRWSWGNVQVQTGRSVRILGDIVA